jgi:hypothetical protein
MADPYGGGGGGSDRESTVGAEEAAPSELAGSLTTGPQGELSVVAGIPSTSIDSEGLIVAGNGVDVAFQYQNTFATAAGTVGGASEYAGEELDADSVSEYSATDALGLDDFGNESMGIFTQQHAGEIVHSRGVSEWSDETGYTETTFRLYAPFQNFNPESPVIAPNPSGVATEDWHIEYDADEIEGLAKSFPYLPSGTTAQDIIEQEMLSMAKEVLQTFPSTELHFSKAKHPRLLDGNLRAFRTREVGQGVSLGLTMTNVEEESSYS